jgi:hypothetical protein
MLRFLKVTLRKVEKGFIKNLRLANTKGVKTTRRLTRAKVDKITVEGW